METAKTQAQNLVERGKSLVEQGNQRQVVFTSKNGQSLLESRLTTIVGIAAVLVITGLISIPLVVIASIIAMVMGIKVDVRQNQ